MSWKSTFVVALAIGAPIAAMAAGITPPAVPSNLAVPPGSKAFAIGHAVGTQNMFACLMARARNGRCSVHRRPCSTRTANRS